MTRLQVRKVICLIAILAALAASGYRTAGGAGKAGRVAAAGVELAIIVNKSNPNDKLSFSELREYFMAERNNWSGGGGKVRVIMREPGQPERDAILKLIYDMSEKDFNSYFLGKKFRGEVVEEPRLRNSSPDVIKTISNLQGAIGYVRADEVDPSVKVIRVDGLAPGDPGYKLKQ